MAIKESKCKTCGHVHNCVYICDHCKKEMDCVAAKVSFGYGSIYDMEEKIFCSDMCLMGWVNEVVVPDLLSQKRGEE